MEFGTDFAFLNGDLGLTAQGDLATVTGTDNLTQALQRRFDTPLGALFCDTSYGNALLLKLSSPMGQTFEKDAVADVTACMLADPLVSSVTVNVTCQREDRIALVQVSYVAQDGTTDAFQRTVSQLV